MTCFSARTLASGPATLDVPSLPVIEAIGRLSARLGLSVGGEVVIDPRIRTRPIRGKMSAEAALRRMLQGTGISVQKLGPLSFRLRRLKLPAKQVVQEASRETTEDIVVTATKRSLPAALLGGKIEYVGFETPLGARDSGRGPADLAARIPSLSSTALGRGRDKLFLRGIADSSFAGATEATLGEYLGEARINFNAPDPGLLLYDVKRVELLKGAQGTLYGGGSLGGVLRIEPERPNLTRTSGFVDATLSSTRSGGLGSALAGVINLPIVDEAIGSRLLAYRTRDAGYIDDVGRNLKNVNRSTTFGGRIQVRTKAGPWQIDVVGTHQLIQSRDSDYASGNFGPLSRATGTAQPSSNSFDLIDVEARREIGGDDLVSTTSIGRNNLSATYDATARVGSPASFQDARRLKTFSHETRLAHSNASGAGWIIGVAGFAEREASEQVTEQPALIELASNLRSNRLVAAIFGQGSHRSGDVLLTAGLRATYSRQKASTDLNLVVNGFADEGRTEINLSPMAEVTWIASKGTSASINFRQGFRSGGNAVYRVDRKFADILSPGFYSLYYAQDIIRVASLEINHRTGGGSPLDLHATASAVRWDDTQGSVVDEYGFLYPVNTNGSTLFNVDLSASWLVQPGLSVRASGSFTFRSALGPATAVAEVPSVPVAAVAGSFAWERPLLADLTLGFEGRVSYRGKSRLGFGFLNGVVQGDVLFTSMGARLKRDGYSLSISVENVADDRASRFGYGNPFTVQTEQQTTPQRPRTLSVGLNAEF